jgi:hypothetical protein
MKIKIRCLISNKSVKLSKKRRILEIKVQHCVLLRFPPRPVDRGRGAGTRRDPWGARARVTGQAAVTARRSRAWPSPSPLLSGAPRGDTEGRWRAAGRRGIALLIQPAVVSISVSFAGLHQHSFSIHSAAKFSTRTRSTY